MPADELLANKTRYQIMLAAELEARLIDETAGSLL